MNHHSARVLDSLRSVQGFLDDHAGPLDVVNKSGARKALDDVVTQITAHAVTQDVSQRERKGETSNLDALGRAIWFNNMKPIATVAKVKLPDVPNFAALKLPPDGTVGVQLASAANSMADAAQPYEQVFLDAGLPADFLKQLRQAADVLSTSVAQRSQRDRVRSGATKGLLKEVKRGREVLKWLNDLVRPMLGKDDRLVAEWRGASKVHKKPGPAVGREPSPVPGGATPPTPVAEPSAAPGVGGGGAIKEPNGGGSGDAATEHAVAQPESDPAVPTS